IGQSSFFHREMPGAARLGQHRNHREKSLLPSMQVAGHPRAPLPAFPLTPASLELRSVVGSPNAGRDGSPSRPWNVPQYSSDASEKRPYPFRTRIARSIFLIPPLTSEFAVMKS